jgi:hypothetical protein
LLLLLINAALILNAELFAYVVGTSSRILWSCQVPKALPAIETFLIPVIGENLEALGQLSRFDVSIQWETYNSTRFYSIETQHFETSHLRRVALCKKLSIVTKQRCYFCAFVKSFEGIHGYDKAVPPSLTVVALLEAIP